jgi:hypothetical protein
MSLEVEDFLTLVRDLILLDKDKDPRHHPEFTKIIIDHFNNLPDENKLVIISSALAFWIHDTDDPEKERIETLYIEKKPEKVEEVTKPPVPSLVKNKQFIFSIFMLSLAALYFLMRHGSLNDFIHLLHNLPEIMEVLFPPL